MIKCLCESWVIFKSVLGIIMEFFDFCLIVWDCLVKVVGDKVYVICFYMYEMGMDLM